MTQLPVVHSLEECLTKLIEAIEKIHKADDSVEYDTFHVGFRCDFYQIREFFASSLQNLAFPNHGELTNALSYEWRSISTLTADVLTSSLQRFPLQTREAQFRRFRTYLQNKVASGKQGVPEAMTLQHVDLLGDDLVPNGYVLHVIEYHLDNSREFWLEPGFPDQPKRVVLHKPGSSTAPAQRTKEEILEDIIQVLDHHHRLTAHQYICNAKVDFLTLQAYLGEQLRYLAFPNHKSLSGIKESCQFIVSTSIAPNGSIECNLRRNDVTQLDAEKYRFRAYLFDKVKRGKQSLVESVTFEFLRFNKINAIDLAWIVPINYTLRMFQRGNNGATYEFVLDSKRDEHIILCTSNATSHSEIDELINKIIVAHVKFLTSSTDVNATMQFIAGLAGFGGGKVSDLQQDFGKFLSTCTDVKILQRIHAALSAN
jgi:hypothetical protein